MIKDYKNINLKKEIINKLEKNYDIKTELIEKNKESTDGNVYIAYSKSNRYVIKIYTDIQHTKKMIELHLLLNKKNLNVPKVIHTLDDKYFEEIENNKYLVVYSFIEGKKLEYYYKNTESLDKNLIKTIARNLRRFHDNTSGENYTDLPKLPFVIKESINRKSILHFDLTKKNIIINKNKIYFIDFDDSKYGASVCDVAITISFLLLSKKKGVDLENINLFINEYYNDDKLKKEEISFIRKYAIKWIDFILNTNNFEISMKESFKKKRDLIKKYL